MNNIDPKERRKIIYIVKNQNKVPEKIEYVLSKVVESGGIDYATKVMENYRDQALEVLYSFPENDARKGLEELVRYTTDRKY